MFTNGSSIDGSNGTVPDEIARCNQEEQIAAAPFGNGCFDEWAADMKCLTAFPRQCPCYRDDCVLLFPGSGPTPCQAEDAAFVRCRGKERPNGDTNGTSRMCHWQSEIDGRCHVRCDSDAMENLHFSPTIARVSRRRCPTASAIKS
jgi:hypothetical protein